MKHGTEKKRVLSDTVHVAMRDGVKLSVHVQRPGVSERVPAILMSTPYHKGALGQPHPIVEYGYATVTFDVRGTGNSEGTTDSVYCDAERQDGYDMVEWAAAQPWCNGNVGIWGISYGAVVALQIAGAAPPHLKAIIARSGSDDPYTEWTNPGGSPRPYIYENYAAIMTASNFCPPDPAEVGSRWRAMWKERLEKNVPWGIPFVRNLHDGPFWRDRSLRNKYDRVKCAVFVVDGWADWYCTPLLRIFSKLTTPKRALIGPWCHQWPDSAVPGPQINWLNECLKWFGYWLKGEDTGVMDEPPVTVFMREYSPPATILLKDAGSFRNENEWPIARTIPTPYYLGERSTLLRRPRKSKGAARLKSDPLTGTTTGMHGGGPYSVNWLMPLDQRPDEMRSLTYTTTPVTHDLEIAGQPGIVLHFSSTAPLTQFVVKLCDVAPDGTSALVTKGYLTVNSGTCRTVEMELQACAYRFRKGHCLRVSVASGDLLNIWPTPQACINTIFCGGGKPSRILLPVIPPPKQPIPKPKLQLSTRPPVRREDLGVVPNFSVAHDRVQETSTVHYTAEYGAGWTHAATYTVSAREPARAAVDSESQRMCRCEGQEIATHARCVTRSDENYFYHDVHLTVRVAGKIWLKRCWETKVKRRDM